MVKTLEIETKAKYDKILKDSSIEAVHKDLVETEKIELKSYAILQKLKLQKYVRN